MNSESDDWLTVVTVTYGDRAEHLRRTLDSVLSQPFVRTVVVSNGSAEPTRKLLDDYLDRYSKRMRVVEFERNQGSAPAFATALRSAYGFDDPILILDDDNPIEAEQLAALRALSTVAELATTDPLALVVHRPVNSAQRAILSGVSVDTVFRELIPGAFHGFDLLSAVRARLRRPQSEDSTIEWSVAGRTFTGYGIPVAMWGGVFLTRKAASLNALPNSELVLYGDDNDFSRALRQLGGCLYLLKELTIADSDAWRPPVSKKRTWRSLFPSTFSTPPNATWRLQYLFRNQAYLSVRQVHGNTPAKVRLLLNAAVRMPAIFVLGVLAGRPVLAWRLSSASFAGLAGRLGKSYPLPG